jgi:cytidyltransferase-like protein
MRIVLTAAIMDMFHFAHKNLLKEMRANGDKVVVVLHDDKSCYEIKGKFPVPGIKQRVKNLKDSGLVDKVYVTKRTDPSDKFKLATLFRKDVIFMRGDDNINYPGKWFIDSKKIPTKFIKYTEGISSTKLRDQL